MATPKEVTLSDAIEMSLATTRLLRCCREEYDYYDGLPRGNPDHIEPSDVLATVSMNSYITNATQVRKIHRGMVTNCDGLLPAIPSDSGSGEVLTDEVWYSKKTNGHVHLLL